jgi:hypothetical protein
MQNNYVMAKNFLTQLCSPMKRAPTSAVVVTKKRGTDRLRWVKLLFIYSCIRLNIFSIVQKEKRLKFKKNEGVLPTREESFSDSDVATGTKVSYYRPSVSLSIAMNLSLLFPCSLSIAMNVL